jgi:hypothetical protein
MVSRQVCRPIRMLCESRYPRNAGRVTEGAPGFAQAWTAEAAVAT